MDRAIVQRQGLAAVVVIGAADARWALRLKWPSETNCVCVSSLGETLSILRPVSAAIRAAQAARQRRVNGVVGDGVVVGHERVCKSAATGFGQGGANGTQDDAQDAARRTGTAKTGRTTRSGTCGGFGFRLGLGLESGRVPDAAPPQERHANTAAAKQPSSKGTRARENIRVMVHGMRNAFDTRWPDLFPDRAETCNKLPVPVPMPTPPETATARRAGWFGCASVCVCASDCSCGRG
ncbi:hypothetical protein ANO11243_073090 [Dothideomycetidae sp. 11243]|nr:hypothetical protein ANO11243_073090 [fungal sp. No.11243]